MFFLYFSCFKNLCFSEPVSSVIQVSEYTILLFKHVFGLFPGLYVIGVPIDRVGSTEVFDLCDSQFPVANLLVQESWFHVARIDVIRPCDDIMLDT